jgi:hypothetical protein
MSAYETILRKQEVWAARHAMELQGSKGDRGKEAYTKTLDENLFHPLAAETRKAFEQGDGGELRGEPCRMQALHSSSALAVNMFEYWIEAEDIPSIAYACGLCAKGNRSAERVRLEVKFPILQSAQRHPNVDVVIENSKGSEFAAFGIESKFSEAYRPAQGEHGVKPEYLTEENSEIWKDVPHLRALAESVSPQDKSFEFLDPSQLIKHTLGMKAKYGKRGFRLLYLWYDALGHEGGKHRDEVARFAEQIKKDGVAFHAVSYQEVLGSLFGSQFEKHREFASYMCDRYL